MTKDHSRATSTSWAVAALLALGLVALGGCQGEPDAETEVAAPVPTGAALPQTGGESDPCLGLDIADAARILGAPEDQVARLTGSDVSPNACGFAYQEIGVQRVISFQPTMLADEHAAVAGMQRERDLAKTALQPAEPQAAAPPSPAEPELGQAVEPVEGVGDEAFVSPVSGTLFVRFGRVVVQVTAPDDRDTQVAVARAIGESLAQQQGATPAADARRLGSPNG